MSSKLLPRSLLFFFTLLISFYWIDAQVNNRSRHNVIIYVADGLRAGSVNSSDTPALWSIRQQGVTFANSHSLFPTFTMANASAIATGHALGDTGVFSNVIWAGYPTYSGTPVPFLENDEMLRDIQAHFAMQFPTETSLMEVAAQQGYNTASIGKMGPAGLLNLGRIAGAIIDDATGTPNGFPLNAALAEEMKKAGLPAEAPTRNNGYGPVSRWNNGYAGTLKQPGTLQANVLQQQWLADVTTRAILPMFMRDSRKPFVLAYWSRDPDGSQHNQGDSLGSLAPGINGDTSRAGVRNADRNLNQILKWLDSNPAVKANTDVVVTSDHGFATISKKEIAAGVVTQSKAATHDYIDAGGNIDTERGNLPYGFLAIDLALNLKTDLFDPDRRTPQPAVRPFRQIRLGPDVFEHPAGGNGLLGIDVRKEDGLDAIAIVAANGGSDLIYVPNKDPATVRRIAQLLATFDYVGGIFVDDAYGALPGTLPISAIGLSGSSSVPRPALVVAFRVFYLAKGDLQSAVQISDASQQQGQGMHGGIGRESTFNNMAAIGPDFRSRFVDHAPVGNADIAPTIAHILGVDLPARGVLRGRIIAEAVRGNNSRPVGTVKHLESVSESGRRTILDFQELNGIRYIDRGCFVEATTCP